MSTQGCICSATRFQRWDDVGHCGNCDRDLSASQIWHRIHPILCGGTGVVLWRNNCGVATYNDKKLEIVLSHARNLIAAWDADQSIDAPLNMIKRALEANYKEAAKVVYGVGNPGGADLIGGFRGRFLAVETKTRRGRQSPEQREWQQVVERDLGGVYAMVRSERDARELLARLMAES